jgi:hypothetical protein
VITTLTSLTHLNLRGCSQFTDVLLQHLLRHLPVLHSLNLQSCSSLSGSFLTPALCRGSTCLQTLNMSFCQSLKIDSLQGMQQLPALQRLDLTGCGVVSGAAALLVLGQLRQLKQLLGGHWRLKGGWEVQAAEAEIGNGSCTSQSQAAAGRSQQFNLSASADPSHQQQDGLQGLLLVPPQLQYLQLNDLTCEESLLQGMINSLPASLTYLDLSNCRVQGGFGAARAMGLQGLQRLKLLQSLNLSGSCGGLAEGGLQYLAALVSLTELQLDHIIHNGKQLKSGMADSCQQQHTAQQGPEPPPAAVAAAARGTSLCSSSNSSNFNETSRACSFSSAPMVTELRCNACSTSQAASPPRLCPPAAGIAALLPPDQQPDPPGKGARSSSSTNITGSSMSTAMAVRRCLFSSSDVDAMHTELTATNCASSTGHSSIGHAVDAGDVQQHLMLQHQEWQQQPPVQRQQQLPVKPCFLQALSGIKKLSISFSPWLDDRALAALSGLVGHGLMNLDLIACHAFSGSGFKAWTCPQAGAAAAAGGCHSRLWTGGHRRLTRLNFTGCTGLSNDGLIWLVEALSGAEHHQQCHQHGHQPPAGTAAEADAAGSCSRAAAVQSWEGTRGLVELNLAGCRGIADSGVAALSGLTGLRLLNLSSNKNITSWCEGGGGPPLA